MEELIRELIPHAPHLGLYVTPDLPKDKLRNALRDYGESLSEADVLALYDATLIGNAKDGALLTRDGITFQNNDFSAAQTVRYTDIVRIDARKKLLGGRKINIEVNRGRATVAVSVDFSAHGTAADYVARFLQEALLRGAAEEMDTPLRGSISTRSGSDLAALTDAFDGLLEDGKLTEEDYEALLAFARSR